MERSKRNFVAAGLDPQQYGRAIYRAPTVQSSRLTNLHLVGAFVSSNSKIRVGRNLVTGDTLQHVCIEAHRDVHPWITAQVSELSVLLESVRAQFA